MEQPTGLASSEQVSVKMSSAILQTAIAPVEEILYPSACPICGMSMRRGADVACDSCDRQLVRLSDPICTMCHRYILPNGLGCNCDTAVAFPQQVAALGVFDPGWRAIVHGLKYHGCRSLAAPLAAAMSRQLNALPEFDAIVAVPTAAHRRRERGFGHAELLAENLALQVGCPYLPGAIGFTRRVSDQTKLRGLERQANLNGAFKATNAASLAGKSILIVDDVLTTGATMAEAGRTLQEAGAAKAPRFGSLPEILCDAGGERSRGGRPANSRRVSRDAHLREALTGDGRACLVRRPEFPQVSALQRCRVEKSRPLCPYTTASPQAARRCLGQPDAEDSGRTRFQESPGYP
ncbi:MAG: ComF family protein [candidate division Zixibacteria bacterium]|nr:ComF family protein [candidate division Zixibacteria bacterium]